MKPSERTRELRKPTSLATWWWFGRKRRRGSARLLRCLGLCARRRRGRLFLRKVQLQQREQQQDRLGIIGEAERSEVGIDLRHVDDALLEPRLRLRAGR